MKYTNMFEKIISLWMIMKDSWFHFVFLGIIVVMIFLRLWKKISKKTCFLISLVSCFGSIIYVICSHFSFLGGVMDQLMDQLFTALYFPSVYVYLFVLIVMIVISFGSFLKLGKKSSYKSFNGVCLLSIGFIFSLVLELIASKRIDVFRKSSLFSNKDLIILLELSVSIFVFWLVGLAVIYLTDVFLERILLVRQKKEVGLANPAAVEIETSLGGEVSEMPEMESKTFLPTLDVVATTQEQEVSSYRYVPTFEGSVSLNKQVMIENMLACQKKMENQENVSQVMDEVISTVVAENNRLVEDSFDLSAFVPREREKKVMVPVESNPILEHILNNDLPLSNANPVNEEKNTYTLNDYRIFNKMLKDIKEHNQSNSLMIDKNLEYRLITKYSTETYDLFKKMLKNYSN